LSRQIFLSGGAEFDDATIPVDKAMLALTRISFPTLVLVPAAAAAHAKRTVRAGMHYFGRLGASPAFTMVVDDQTAESGEKAVTLENCDAIYLTDGSPLDAAQTLRGSGALKTIRNSWGRGAIFAACGASAMALCPQYWDGGVWETGLGVLKKLAVLPHHQVVAGRYSHARLSAGLPEGTQIVGLEDSTGLHIVGETAKVIGAGAAVVYTPDDELEYLHGETFTLLEVFG
jgi:cyanophycinase-like exopeptidase